MDIDLNVLIVDDSKTVRGIIKRELKQFTRVFTSVNTFEATNGLEALEILKDNEDVNIIISDWNMPEMNGLEFVNLLKKIESTKDIPILMITVNSAKNDVMKAVKSGVNGYLIKPFKGEELLRKISYLLKYKD